MLERTKQMMHSHWVDVFLSVTILSLVLSAMLISIMILGFFGYGFVVMLEELF